MEILGVGSWEFIGSWALRSWELTRGAHERTRRQSNRPRGQDHPEGPGSAVPLPSIAIGRARSRYDAGMVMGSVPLTLK